MQKPADGRITRAIALPPGDYELFVAVKERSSVPAAAAAKPPTPPRSQDRTASSRRPRSGFQQGGSADEQRYSGNRCGTGQRQLSPAEQEANPRVRSDADCSVERRPLREEQRAAGGLLGIRSDGGAGKPDVLIDFNFHLRQPDGTEK